MVRGTNAFYLTFVVAGEVGYQKGIQGTDSSEVSERARYDGGSRHRGWGAQKAGYSDALKRFGVRKNCRSFTLVAREWASYRFFNGLIQLMRFKGYGSMIALGRIGFGGHMLYNCMRCDCFDEPEPYSSCWGGLCGI